MSPTRGNCSSLLLLRRNLLAGSLALASRPGGASAIGGQADWTAFRSRFISAEGRVIDVDNAGISHSEGQGWGMLFAVAFDDQPTFDRILAWTSRNLRRPRDSLHAWRYDPAASPPVNDLNNAADGDIFIATALMRACARWNTRQYAKSAGSIAGDILRLLVRRVGRRTVLLPGAGGFEQPDAVILNLSYYAMPLIPDLAQARPSPRWNDVVLDGAALVQQARFGRFRLPPDWLRIHRDSGAVDIAPGWPSRFSFDAIRIPLWFTWARRPVSGLQQALQQFWEAYPPGQVPAWVDLVSGETAAYPATPGMVAVQRLTLASIQGATPDLPAISPTTGYYDGALILLSQMALKQFSSR